MVNGNCRLKKGPLLKKTPNIFRAVVYPLLLVGTVMGNINLFTFVCFTQSFSSDVGLGLLGSNPLKTHFWQQDAYLLFNKAIELFIFIF